MSLRSRENRSGLLSPSRTRPISPEPTRPRSRVVVVLDYWYRTNIRVRACMRSYVYGHDRVRTYVHAAQLCVVAFLGTPFWCLSLYNNVGRCTYGSPVPLGHCGLYYLFDALWKPPLVFWREREQGSTSLSHWRIHAHVASIDPSAS